MSNMKTINPLVKVEAIEERAYQFRIAEEATRRNTIVVLPTALGKTVIAALVASHFLYNYQDRKVLVMAPTRPLILQHRDTFMKLLKLRTQDVQVLTGKYDSIYRLHAWRGNHRIYFATPQVVNNDYRHGMNLKDFSLMIFDECHRARKNYAYTRVAQAYVKDSPYPIILGLTASPGANKERVREICEALYIERVEAKTEDDPEIKPFVSPTTIEWKFVTLPETYRDVEDVLKRMLEGRLRRLSALGVIRKNPRFIFRYDLLKAGEEIRCMIDKASFEGERGRLYGVLVLQSAALTLYHAIELLGSQGPYTLKLFLERIKKSNRTSHKSIVTELIPTRVYETLESGSLGDHPKVDILEKFVLERLASNPSSKIIVFTQYRDTSSFLASKLSRLGLQAARFIGQTNREWDSGMTQDQQALLLERFRSGDIRVLVATSIGEEGLDIPSVDLVVFYEPVPSEIRYIQRKGRTGRRRFGRVVILAAEGTLDVGYLKASRKMAEKMKWIVKKLNAELNPIIRLGAPPEMNIMPMKTIFEADTLAPQTLQVRGQGQLFGVETDNREKEQLRSFNREVRKLAKNILALVLKVGSEGTSVRTLTTEFEEDGINPGLISAAVNKLNDENQVKVFGGRIVPAGVTSGTKKASHFFEVDKILSGKAILLVDGKWRAVLTPDQYDGPRQLLRRGNSFKAIAKLYKLDGKLHVIIYAIESASV